MSAPLKGDSLMPWGMYKGHKMKDIPEEYLLWLHKTGKYCFLVKKYVVDRLYRLEDAG